MEELFFRFDSLSKFTEITHGISPRSWGNMSLERGKPTQTIKNREQFLKELGGSINQLVVPSMVHGGKIEEVRSENKGQGSQKTDDAISGADGLITKEKGIFLMVTSADCPALMVYDPVQLITGIAHCGWRGIAAGIVGELINKFRMEGSDEENLVCGIGPGICQKHFVVRNEVLSQFLTQYPSARFVRNKDGYVDLKKAIQLDLKRNGVLLQNIEISKICSACQNGVFGSYRLEGDEVVASGAVIGMRGEQ